MRIDSGGSQLQQIARQAPIRRNASCWVLLVHDVDPRTDRPEGLAQGRQRTRDVTLVVNPCVGV